MDKQLKCGIIGAGKVGSALSEQLHKLDMLAWVVARSAASRARVDFLPPSSIFSSLDDISSLPNIIIIAVDDNSIQTIAGELSRNFAEKLSGKLILHLSGTRCVTELNECLLRGATIAAAHPFQTFFLRDEKALDGTAWGIESSDEAFARLEPLIHSLKGIPVKLTAEQIAKKALYHASAVAASNYLTATIELSKQIAREAGISSETFLPAIIKQTVRNNLAHVGDEIMPLTGPIARGDAKVVREQLSMIADSALRNAYATMGLATAVVAHEKDMINNEQFNIFVKIFSEIMTDDLK